MTGELYVWLSDAEHAAREKWTRTAMPTGALDLYWATATAEAWMPATLGPVYSGEHRYRIEPSYDGVFVPWVDHRATIDIVDYMHLELAARARPDLWLVSTRPSFIQHDPLRR